MEKKKKLRILHAEVETFKREEWLLAFPDY